MGVNGIYGLSGSGMDIESMVKVGMMSKQNEYDKMAQKFTKNEWMKADYIELNNKITTFNASTLSQYKMSNTMNAKGAESSSEAVKVSANSTAALMSHKVEVTALSSNAYLVGTNSMTRYDLSTGKAYKSTDSESASIKLKDVLFQTLKENNGNVYGTVAVTDMDMEKTSRDKNEGLASADQIKADDNLTISGAYKIGYTDGTKTITVNAHFEDLNGNTVTLTQADILAKYGNKTNPNYNYDWRATDDENGGIQWQRYLSGHWVNADPESSENNTNSFTNFINHSSNSSHGLTWVATHDEQVADKAAVASGLDKKTTVAFSFTLSDGVTKNESGTGLKEVKIEYTYEQLLDEDNGITFNDLVSKINGSGLNVKASYDSIHDKFSIYNTTSGKDNTVTISFGENTDYTGSRAAMVTRNFFNNMGLYQSKNGALYDADGDPAVETDKNAILFSLKGGNSDGVNNFNGENGTIKIDGVTYNDVVDNKLTVAGVTYTAVSTTLNKDANGNVIPSNPATITVTQDTDSIIDKVKSFITDYNKLLADLYAKYDEKPNSDYKPLTQSQKDQMKDEQIEKWEEKAKAGLLYHDQTLGKIIMNMRDAVSESIEGVDSKYNSIYSLGISTTGLKGQLVLDEDKLKKALAEDPDAVYNVFAKLESTSTDNGSAVYKTQKDANSNVIKITNESNGNGIAQRLGDIFVSANKLIKERAGSSSDITEDSDLNNLLRNLQTKMSNFKKLMASFEDALYKKYDAMESTLARLGTQLNYIMGSTGQ